MSFETRWQQLRPLPLIDQLGSLAGTSETAALDGGLQRAACYAALSQLALGRGWLRIGAPLLVANSATGEGLAAGTCSRCPAGTYLGHDAWLHGADEAALGSRMQQSAGPGDGRSYWPRRCRRFSGRLAVHRADHEQRALGAFVA
jgi:hypothetical protein